MDNSRFEYKYIDESYDQILNFQHLVNSILDLLESSTNLDSHYLKQRINLLVDCLRLREKIENRSHVEDNFLHRIIEQEIVLETEGLSRYQGILEIDLKYPDLAAIYRTGIEDSQLLDNVRLNLSIINFNLLSRYFKELDPKIHEKSCTVFDLIQAGLPTNPVYNEDSW